VLTKLFAYSFIFMFSALQAHAACDDTYETAMAAGLPPVTTGLEFDELPAACIDASMATMEKLVKANGSRPFAYCENGLPKQEKKPLCRTEKLVKGVYDSVHIVADCLNIPAKALFPIMNVESGFFPNAVGVKGNDAGVGQVTPIAALDVNQRWGWLETHVIASSRPSCQYIANILPALQAPTLPEKEHVCALIDPSTNPLRNSLYAGFFFLLNKKYLNDFFYENEVERRMSALLGRPTTTQEIDDVIHLLNIISYNRGFTEVRDAFLGYLEAREKKAGIDWASLQTLLTEIMELELRIQDAKTAGEDIAVIQTLRDDLATKKEAYNQLLEIRPEEVMDYSLFQIRNNKSGSLRAHLKSVSLHKYLELVLARDESTESKLGAGFCGQLDGVPKSTALDFMIWE